MKKNILIISALLVITALIAGLYLKNRARIPENAVLVRTASGDVYLDLKKLPLSHVEGEQANQKGEVKHIDGEGTPLSEIPSLAGVTDYTEIAVFSDDEYNAVVTKEEAAVSNNAWLLLEDGQLRLIVLNDPNTKRSVKNVVRIEVR